MKTRLTLILILITPIVVANDYDVPFTTIDEGESLIRDKGDNTYSAVIYDQQGLEDFLEIYPIRCDIKSGIFKKYLLIVGFSDTSWTVRCDGLKHKSITNSPRLYLDLHDKGIRVEVDRALEGKKYTAWCVIAAPRDLIISHVQVREGISGLCKQFGENNSNHGLESTGAPPAAETPETHP